MNICGTAAFRGIRAPKSRVSGRNPRAVALSKMMTNFVDALRAADLQVSPAETLDAMEAADLVGFGDRRLLKDTLALSLAKTPDEKQAFDEAFDRFFSFETMENATSQSGQEGEDQDQQEAGEGSEDSDGQDSGDGDESDAEGDREGEGEGGGGGALGEVARESEADDLGGEHIDGLAQHDRLRLDAAHAPPDDAQTIDHGGVRVGADEGVGEDVVRAVDAFGEDAPREVLEVDLVHDAGGWRDDAEVVERLLAPLEELVALVVALELLLRVHGQRDARREVVDLHRVVDDEIRRASCRERV